MSILMTGRMTPDHRKAWQRLTDALRRVDMPDGPACQATPEAYWPGLVRLGFERRNRIKQQCRRCPVQAECLAMGRFERFGVWGGSQFIDGRAVT